MARAKVWIGLDVGEDRMAMCAINRDGNVLAEEDIGSTAKEFRSALSRLGLRRPELIAIEAGSVSVHLVRLLRKMRFSVAVFETRQVSKFLEIRQNKTDRNDARGLAEVARIGRGVVAEVLVKSPECQQLRSTLVLRQRLIRMRVTAETSMRALIRLNGGRLKASWSASSLRRNVPAALADLRRSQGIDISDKIEPLLTVSESLRRQVEQIDRELVTIAQAHPVCRRFLEIPGVGTICALSFFTAIDEPSRFHRNADVGAYLGMTPMVRQSGQSNSRIRISKMGNRMARTHLVTAAGVHLRLGKDSALRTWGLMLAERNGRTKGRVAVARKLAIMMLAMWKSGTAYFPSGTVLPTREPEKAIAA